MTDVSDRLTQARSKAGYETATDAANAFGWNPVTYRAHEAGDRGLKPDVAKRYARAFKVSVAWLTTGEGASDKGTAEIIDIWSRIGDANARKEVLDFARWKASQKD
jgi:DNA-binding XRE family transcriptional regulator